MNNTREALHRGKPWLILLALMMIFACEQRLAAQKDGGKMQTEQVMK